MARASLTIDFEETDHTISSLASMGSPPGLVPVYGEWFPKHHELSTHSLAFNRLVDVPTHEHVQLYVKRHKANLAQLIAAR